MNGAIMLAMTNTLELPTWLSPSPDQSTLTPVTPRQLQEKQFEIFFETLLDKIARGINLKECLRDDQRDFDYTAKKFGASGIHSEENTGDNPLLTASEVVSGKPKKWVIKGPPLYARDSIRGRVILPVR